MRILPLAILTFVLASGAARAAQNPPFLSSSTFNLCYADPDSVPGPKLDAQWQAVVKARETCFETNRKAERISEWKIKSYHGSCHYQVSASFVCYE